MTLVPHKNETLVLPFTASQAMYRLSRVTQPASLNIAREKEADMMFVGVITNESFSVSRIVDYPQNYLPIISGVIECSSRGCILFLKYRLFFSSILFFSFWTILTLFLGMFLILFTPYYGYAALAVLSCAANYLVTILNFNRQVQLSREALHKALKISA